MTISKKIVVCLVAATLTLGSCVSKKQLAQMKLDMQAQIDAANKDAAKCGADLNKTVNELSGMRQEAERCKNDLKASQNTVKVREDQIQDLRNQLDDLKKMRDKQLTQVTDLTSLSQSANQNIKETLGQLEKKDKYIQLLQAAKTRADSINLALAVNLKSVLNDGVMDKDVEVKVDKTVVFVNLSDKMMFTSGSSAITPKAQTVLGKIAQIVASRPDLEVMVEGYTDNVAIKNNCIEDNWDLSVKRATSVVRALQKSFGVDPNRLIAAGRGEYNTLADNATDAGRSTNRRTRIIILPKLDQFYDLLNPNNVPKN
jgi:chemotaxis protein MotB